MAAIEKWLRAVPYPDYLIGRILEENLPTRFPEDTLRLLQKIIGEQPEWLPPELRRCLDAIGQAAPRLRQDPMLRSLEELERRFEV